DLERGLEFSGVLFRSGLVALGHSVRVVDNLGTGNEANLDIVVGAGEIGFVPRAEIVYHPNAVPESNEPRGKMRTDETGAARYQEIARASSRGEREAVW